MTDTLIMVNEPPAPASASPMPPALTSTVHNPEYDAYHEHVGGRPASRWLAGLILRWRLARLCRRAGWLQTGAGEHLLASLITERRWTALDALLDELDGVERPV